MYQTQSTEMRQELGQFLRVEQAVLLEMPESDFNSLIIETEKTPLFQKLYRKEKLIRYQKFPRTDISPSFYLKEEVVADTGSPDVESLLLNREDIVIRVQKIGLENFKRCFLFPESGLTLEEIAEKCDISVSEVRRINSLIDDVSILSEFYHPSNVVSGGVHYSKVASVRRDDKGFVVDYFSPSFVRGRYLIDYGRFEELAASDVFTESDIKQVRQLLKKLELINCRKDTLNQILQNVIEKQTLYLDSGDAKSLLIFSQKELALKIGIAPSSVSRAIRYKSVNTPWGQEIPLKNFFPGPSKFKKELLRQLLENNRLPSDEATRMELWERFGVAISRRSVANLRKQLKFPPARERRYPVGGKENK